MRRIVRLATELLYEDEKLLDYAVGMRPEDNRTSVLVATDKRLFRFTKKFLGDEVEELPYRNITSIVVYRKALVGYTITVTTAGNEVELKMIPPGDEPEEMVMEVQRRIAA